MNDIKRMYTIIDSYIPRSSDYNKLTKKVYWDNWKNILRLPASTSKLHHHAKENIVPGGLINHSIRAVAIGKMLCEEERIENYNDVMCALFIHDVGKTMTTKPNHGFYSMEMVRKYKDCPDSVQKMCLRHMHKWDENPAQTVKERIVAYADYIASRKEIEVVGLEYFL